MLVNKLSDIELSDDYCVVTPIPDETDVVLILVGKNTGKFGQLINPCWTKPIHTNQSISCFVCESKSFLFTLRTSTVTEVFLASLGFTRNPETLLYNKGDIQVDLKGCVKTASVSIEGLITPPLILSLL